MKTTVVIVALIAITLSGCNANFAPQLSPATSTASTTIGEIIYAGYDFTVTRVIIHGLPYLVNSKGGIILEASEAE